LAARRAQLFLPPEAPLTERLMPDATPELGSSLLFPPNALEGVRPRGRLLQVGKFAISPGVEIAGAYDDNIDASQSDRKDDITGNLGASLRADSLFERHRLGFEIDASIGNPQENLNTTDRIAFTSRVDGRLDLTPRSTLSAEASFTRGSQSPEAQEAGAEEEPTIYTAASAVAYRQTLEHLGWEVASGVSRTESDGGDEASEQDRTSYTVSPSVTYEVTRRLGLFAETGYSIDDYDHAGEGGSRDAQTVGATVGTTLGLGRTFAARLGVGYIGVFFEDSERDDQNSPTFTADLTGAISLDRLTLLGLGLNHATEPTTADEAALVTRTRLFASINRLLTPASAVLARVSFVRSDFIDESRADDDIIVELAYSHILIRNIALNLGYRFSQRFSDEKEDEFYRNLVTVGLSATF
jgi:hypothetical protein